MLPIHKYTFGVLLLLVGGLWFVFSLIWLPPLSLFVAILNLRWLQNTPWLWGLDLAIGLGVMVIGLVFLKKSRKGLKF